MTKPWHETEFDEEAMDFSSGFWATHRDNLDVEEFWADRIKKYRGEPVERLRIAVENLPLPAAFREAAVATRALIREKRKLGQDYEEGLTLLYWLAATSSFSVPYSEALQQPGYNVLESIPGAVVKNLPFTYETLGYEKLTLLNKTDIKWLKEAWGETQTHSTLNAMHAELWKKYERELKGKQEQQLKAAISRLDPPGEAMPAEAGRGFRKWPLPAVIVAVVVVVLIFIVMES